MATDLQNGKEQSTASLMTGIVDDLHDLVKQQVELTRHEIKDEVQRASEALELYTVGAAVFLVGLVLVGLAAANLVHWASSPLGTDPGRIPLWTCYAIVGALPTLIGAGLAWMGRTKLGSINPFHNAATEALKENVKWATNSK